MKKLITLIIFLIALPVFAQEEAPSDPSGNDLNPVIRGLNLGMHAGLFVIPAGSATAKNSGYVGPKIDLSFGYDIVIGNYMKIGPAINIGMVQMSGTPAVDAPWVSDFAPLVAGLDVAITGFVTERFEVGGIISADFYMLSQALNSSGDEKDLFIGIGGGFYTEYYAYLRHFSLGISVEFNYMVNMKNTMPITVLPFIKYSF